MANYNQTDVESNFRAAWEKFGGGNVLETNWFFENYLKPTATLVDYLRDNNLSSNLFSEEMYDLWTALYGSPNPTYYKNIAFNAIAGFLYPAGTPFQFMVKMVNVSSTNNPEANAAIIMKALQTCNYCDLYLPYVSSLAPMDGQLSSRAAHKISLA